MGADFDCEELAEGDGFAGDGGDLDRGLGAAAVEDDGLVAGVHAEDIDGVMSLGFVKGQGVEVPGFGGNVETMHGMGSGDGPVKGVGYLKNSLAFSKKPLVEGGVFVAHQGGEFLELAPLLGV